MSRENLARWHQVIESRDASLLDDLLADEVVFHSPVVHTPQRGKPITRMYLTAAMHVLMQGEFRYVRELVDGNEMVLEFETELDGITINGVDMIRCNDAGQITDFKVMVRPLKAIQKIHELMAGMLQNLKG